jgi:hypothetical protein
MPLVKKSVSDLLITKSVLNTQLQQKNQPALQLHQLDQLVAQATPSMLKTQPTGVGLKANFPHSKPWEPLALPLCSLVV